jgi:hypothetical protein
MNGTATTANMHIHGVDADDRTMLSVADAVRDASKAAAVQAAGVKNAISEMGLMRSVARITYTSAYVLSFGIVYPAVFVAQWIPQPVKDGFGDGARAAMDSLNAA